LLNQFLLDSYQKGDNVALIIDEAQNLSPEVTESIRLLSNFETSQDKLLQIVMVGQPELATRLDSDELQQLKQRVAVRCNLEPLSFGECSEYITKRIEGAGGDPSILSPKAIETVYLYSGGTPRVINILCDNGLLSAFAAGKKVVDTTMIRDAAHSLNLTVQPELINPGNGHSYSNRSIKYGSKEWVLGETRLDTKEVKYFGNARKPSSVINLPQARPSPKPKGERLGKVLAGRNLRGYITHPLVALQLESPVADQFRILREHVRQLRADTGARSLLVTSAIKGDGKSLVAANLAAATALEDKEQVLLIEADLRSPEIHRYFNVESTPGLTECLRSDSEEDLSHYVHDTFLPNLKVLPAGRPHRLPSELLAKLKTHDLLSLFPNHQIIIDSAPVLSTADPLVLTRLVEGIIMVIRAGKTPRKRLFEALTTLNSKKLMGIVLNGTELGTTSKYYHYSNKKD